MERQWARMVIGVLSLVQIGYLLGNAQENMQQLYANLENMSDIVHILLNNPPQSVGKAWNDFGALLALQSHSQQAYNHLSDGGSARAHTLTHSSDRKDYFMNYVLPGHEKIAAWVQGHILNNVQNPYGVLLLQAPALDPYILKAHTFLHDRFNAGTGYFGLPWGEELSFALWKEFDDQRNCFVQMISRVIGSHRAALAKKIWNLDLIDVIEEFPLYIPGRPKQVDDRNLILLSRKYTKNYTSGLDAQAFLNNNLQYQLGILAPVVPLWDFVSNIAISQDGHAVIFDTEQPNNLNYLPGKSRNTIGGGRLTEDDLARNPTRGVQHFLGLGFGNAVLEYIAHLRNVGSQLALSENDIENAVKSFSAGVSVSAREYRRYYPYVDTLWNSDLDKPAHAA